jgi:acetyl esterase/lipase
MGLSKIVLKRALGSDGGGGRTRAVGCGTLRAVCLAMTRNKTIDARRRVLLLGPLGLLVLACSAVKTEQVAPQEKGAGGSGGMSAVPAGNAGQSSMHPPAPFNPPASGYAEINLYPGDPPNYLASAPPESVDADVGLIHDVSIPTLRRYPVDLSKSSGVAFVAFPGGSYNLLDMERQATALATRLGPLGISVFGLKSRVGLGSSDPQRDALLDAERALRLMRSHAAEWSIAPNRIGIASWSSGSHLALTLAGHVDAGMQASDDPVEQASDRPDFMAVMCPAADGASVSPFTFTPETPPIYLCHAEDDDRSPIALARAIDQQLQANGTLEHLEVYPTGGHFAFSVGDPTATGRDWPDKVLPWLRNNQLIEGSSTPPSGGLETEHGGLSLEQWMKAFFTSRFGGEPGGRFQDRVFLPKPTKTGVNVKVNDHDAEAATASVVLGAGDGVAVPLYVHFGDVDEAPASFDDAAFASAFVRVTVDGALLFDTTRDDINRLLFGPVLLDAPLPYPGDPDLTVAWLQGAAFLLAPMSAGTHLLHYEVEMPDFAISLDGTITAM